MQLRYLALCQGNDFDPGELHPLEQSGDVLLVAREAIRRLSDNDIERRFPRPLSIRA